MKWYWGVWLVTLGLVMVGLGQNSREGARLLIDKYLPASSAGIVGGMVLGDGGGFTFSEKEDWRRAGLWHLVVASGSNLMWLSRWLVEGTAGLITRRGAIGVGLISMWGYTAWLGWPVALVRAVILMTIYYLAQIVGRRFDVYRAVAVAGIIMVAASPTVITQAGFWLSIGAYIGVVSGNRNGEESWWKSELKTSLRVAWWTWPILVAISSRWSLLTPVVSLGAMPVAPVVLGGGMAAVIVGTVWEWGGGAILIALGPFVNWFNLLADWGGKFGVVEGLGVNWVVWVGWAIITFWMIRSNKSRH